MIILGIDPGIADTGYGVIETTQDNKIRCITYGSIKTDSKETTSRRLLKIDGELEKIIQAHKPEIAGVEQLFFCSNAKTAIIVGQARGVVLCNLARNNIKLKEFTPLQVKQAVTCYGKADKKQVQSMIKIILNLKEIPKPDDAADALAIAVCAINT